ncbi:MAG TPA: FadR/GntR family transcriptional regulator [Phototrophicaceae bacterium]|nr:FadR/GntR family transcriptional regulator [Phototrophicaceae bacterium]
MTSNILLHRVRKVRISETVVDQILDLIDEGRLKIGDQLPGERDLVNQLQVGRASVREALRILEAQGVIEVQPGKGTFIVGETIADGDEGIVQWFQQHVDEEFDFLEVRDALDRKAASLAAVRATDAEIAEMSSLIDEADAYLQSGDLDKVVALDKQFHCAIAETSGNDMLCHLLVSIHEAMVNPRRSLIRLKGRAAISQAQHRRIFEAIKQRDPEAAEAAVVAHNNSVREAIKSLTNESK